MDQETKMSIISHLEELRKVLIVSLFSLIPTTGAAWYFREDILRILMRPLINIYPDYTLQTLGPADAIFGYLKMSVAVGFMLALPVIMWQVWSFILPALKETEKKALRFLVPISVLLFVGGVAFAYFTVFNIGLRVLLQFGGENINPSYTFQGYLSFAVTFLLPFGLVFELPIAVLFLTRLGIVTPQFLAKQRKFALLIIFCIAAILTPGPDVVSQFLMAAPMYILFEISIWLSYFVKAKKKKQAEAEEAEVQGEEQAPVVQQLEDSKEAKEEQEPEEEEVKEEVKEETNWITSDAEDEDYQYQPSVDEQDRKERLEQILDDSEKEKQD